jgi:hypothetical protein
MVKFGGIQSVSEHLMQKLGFEDPGIKTGEDVELFPIEAISHELKAFTNMKREDSIYTKGMVQEPLDDYLVSVGDISKFINSAKWNLSRYIKTRKGMDRTYDKRGRVLEGKGVLNEKRFYTRVEYQGDGQWKLFIAENKRSFEHRLDYYAVDLIGENGDEGILVSRTIDRKGEKPIKVSARYLI